MSCVFLHFYHFSSNDGRLIDFLMTPGGSHENSHGKAGFQEPFGDAKRWKPEVFFMSCQGSGWLGVVNTLFGWKEKTGTEQKNE